MLTGSISRMIACKSSFRDRGGGVLEDGRGRENLAGRDHGVVGRCGVA